MKKTVVDFFTNLAPHYRDALWKGLMVSDLLDVQFHFGQKSGSTIRTIDFNTIEWKKNSERLHHFKNRYARDVLVWQSGALKNIFRTNAEVVVLLGQMYVVSTWLVVIIARIRGIETVFWGHGAYGREKPLKRWFRNRFLSLASMIWVYGHHARNLLIDDGIDPDHVRVVFNSLDHAAQLKLRQSILDTEFFQQKGWFFQSSAPVLIFVGRLTRQKELDKLIYAVAELRKSNRLFNLLIVGDGPQRKELEKLASSLSGQIHFYGACYDELELGKMIANADLCVSPGEVGLTAMHVLTYGTPVCTHGLMEEQMPEAEAVIEGQTGVLFDQCEMDISSAISRWFDAAIDRKKVRERCYQEIDERWNTKNQIKIMTSSIDELVCNLR